MENRANRSRGRGRVHQTYQPGEVKSPNIYGAHYQNIGQQSSTNSRPPRQQQIPMSGVPYGYLPAFLPGSASLTEQLDRRVMIVLRDGRHLIGILRSFDQFSNMVLEETSERRILHQKLNHPGNPDGGNAGGAVKSGDSVICYYADIHIGLYLVRGDSMVLLGEVADEKDDCEIEKRSDGEMISVSEAISSGSGLLMGGEMDVQKTMKTHMKKVALEELEELEKKFEEEKKIVDTITWDFDLDLAI